MDREPIRLTLVSLPPGSEPTRLEFAAPLGSRVSLTARIAEMLPGTTFETRGLNARGAFKRASYQIAFSIEGHEPTTVDVQVDGPDGFAALKRLVDKNGWQAIDPTAGAFVDLDRSRAAGRAVAVKTAPDDATIRMRVPVEAPKPTRRPAWLAAVIVLLAASVPAAWYFTRGPHGASEATISLTPWPPPYLHLPPMARTSTADARRTFAVQLALASEEISKRGERVVDLAPQFRGDEIVQQLLQYRDAATSFPSSAGENGFMGPDRLSDAAFFAAFNATPKLPAWFTEPKRDGYVFTFTGDDCTWKPRNVEIGTLCFGFVYSALPIDATGSSRRGYALYSHDQRIHYRLDGTLPMPGDPTVDKSAHAAEAPSVAARENSALHDLAQVAAIENLVSALSRGYVPPDRLADAAAAARSRLPPLLPAPFRDATRLGYTFEFNGDEPRSGGAWGAAYGSFVYVAKPQESSDRTFALYPDGRIFATADRRVPTNQDTAVAIH